MTLSPRPTDLVATRSDLVYADPANPWVSVYFDEVEWPDGRRGRYNRVVEGSGHPGVAILPILADSIGLIQVDRYPVGLRVWEIPRGFGEGPDADVEARRELNEETGWQASELIRLGDVHLNSGLLAGSVTVFAALVDEDSGRRSDDEALCVSTFSVAEVKEAIRQGFIHDAVTTTALLLAEVHGLLTLGD